MEFTNVLLLTTSFLGIGLNVFFQKIFIKRNKFDSIKQRSSHNTLATKTGGIALFSSVFLMSLYFYFTNNEIFDFTLLIPLSIIFVIGVYDDFYEADFKLKFFIQIFIIKFIESFTCLRYDKHSYKERYNRNQRSRYKVGA